MTRAVLVWTWFVVDVGSTPLVSPPWRDIPAGSYPPALRARPLGNLLIILTGGDARRGEPESDFSFTK